MVMMSQSLLVRLVSILGSLELNLQAFHADLKAVHGLNGGLCRLWIVVAHESEALALIGGTVHVDLGRDDIPKRNEHLRQLGVAKVRWQVVNEQVAALGALFLRRRTGLARRYDRVIHGRRVGGD